MAPDFDWGSVVAALLLLLSVAAVLAGRKAACVHA